MNDTRGKSYWSNRRSLHCNVAAHVADIESYRQQTSSEEVIDTCDLNDEIDFGISDFVDFIDNAHDVDDPAITTGCEAIDDDAELLNVERTPARDPCEQDDNDASELDNGVYDFLSVSDSLSETDTLSESGSDCEYDGEHLRSQLADCFRAFNVTHALAAAVLQIFRPYHPSLPKDPRTLMGTPAQVDVMELAGGSYHHFGIEKSIKSIVERRSWNPYEKDLTFYIQINIDGLPIFKSSGLQFWPILGMVKEPFASEPFVIAIYSGNKKPDNVGQYLSQFVVEARKLEVDGFVVLGKKVFVHIQCFVCDAPARCFLKNTKSFTGYYGCDRCIQEGEHISNRMTFPDVSAKHRSDQGFADMIYEEHHLSDIPSPLTKLSVGLVTAFVLDYMHLVCLGVVRRLIITWLRGPLSARLPARKVIELSASLEKLRLYTPSELARKPRGLGDVDRWKATEFRQFLLYTSPVVLCGFLPDALYKHFLLLHVALTILVSKNLSDVMCNYAEKLLLVFVEHGSKIYGPQFLVYNVHSLVHIVDDVRRYGPLDEISCFPFENYLGKIKKAVRSPFNPLQQVINRLSENQLATQTNNDGNHFPFPLLQGEILDSDHSLADPVRYTSLRTEKFLLSSSNKNCYVLLSGNRVGKIRYFYDDNSTIFVAVQLFGKISSYYHYPLPSQDVGIVVADSLASTIDIVTLDDVVTKYFGMPTDGDKFVMVQMHH